MTANNYQIGGTHYKSKYEHWDLVADTEMGYLEGCVTKYISRHKKKHGLIDLQKAKHYLTKLIETCEYHRAHRKNIYVGAAFGNVDYFCQVNKIGNDERRVMKLVAAWQLKNDLEQALDALQQLIERYEPVLPFPEQFRPGTPEDGGHHAA